jgi:hypothetical protein
MRYAACCCCCCCRLFQSVLGEDLKASDMELGVVTAADGFKVLSAAEVDTFLTIISERD